MRLLVFICWLVLWIPALSAQSLRLSPQQAAAAEQKLQQELSQKKVVKQPVPSTSQQQMTALQAQWQHLNAEQKKLVLARIKQAYNRATPQQKQEIAQVLTALTN